MMFGWSPFGWWWPEIVPLLTWLFLVMIVAARRCLRAQRRARSPRRRSRRSGGGGCGAWLLLDRLADTEPGSADCPCLGKRAAPCPVGSSTHRGSSWAMGVVGWDVGPLATLDRQVDPGPVMDLRVVMREDERDRPR
jgi:hypothetical protein